MTATIYNIIPPNATYSIDPIPIKINYISETEDVVSTALANPSSELNNVIVSLLLNDPEQ